MLAMVGVAVPTFLQLFSSFFDPSAKTLDCVYERWFFLNRRAVTRQFNAIRFSIERIESMYSSSLR